MNPLWALAALGILSGTAMRWIFQSVANSPAIAAVARRIQAHLLEFWIFVDEPTAIWKSWKGLLRANARLLVLLLVPLTVLSIPMLPLLLVLDAFYGTSPLPVGKLALVTLGLNRPVGIIPQLRTPDGIAVESPAVRVFTEREVSWRIRPLRPLSGELQWVAGEAKLTRSVVAGDGFSWHWRRRRSLPYLAAGPVRWIEVSYPPAAGLHWSIWFFAFSMIGAFLSNAVATRGRT